VAALPPSARPPVEGRAPGEVALDLARRKAAGSGLLALKNEISALSAALPALALKPDATPAPGVGTTAGAGAGSEPGEPARALVTASAGRSSGGIASAVSLSRDSGGASLPGRATTMPAGTGTGAGAGGATGMGLGGAGGKPRNGTGAGAAGLDAGVAAGGDAMAAAGKPGVTAAARGSGRATRSIEDIKLVFERQKGAIYALYNRALRDDPALQGKVVLELKIAPGGQVTALRIVSSELKSEELERKLLARIRQFDFGARDVDALVLTWPVDFLPS
jgi:TonB family protein